MDFLNDIHWVRGQPIDMKERNLIIYLFGCGLTSKDIAIALSRDNRTVGKWLQRWLNTGDISTLGKTGRPRATNVNEEIMINLHAIDDPRKTLNNIKHDCELHCSLNTIGKRLRENNLYCRVARIKESLSAGHRARRLQFAENHLHFMHWDRTIFVDESTFETGHAVRTLVRRPIGAALDPHYIVEKARSGRRSVPVFGLLHRGEVGPLVRIEGHFDSEKYIDILDGVVLPYIEDQFHDGFFYYYQDNSPIHRAGIIRNWFQTNIPEDQLFETPAKAYDITPIENLWGKAKVDVAHNGIYADQDDLWLAISDTWLEFRQNINYAQILVDSVPNRLQAIIDANGGHTRY